MGAYYQLQKEIIEASNSELIPYKKRSHFTNISKDVPALDRSCLPTFLPNDKPRQLQPWNVLTEINKLKLTKSSGPDGFSAKFLKTFGPEIAGPLCDVINASYRENTVPQEWKHAHVVAIPKAHDKPITLDNIRPIALTDHFAKIAEQFVAQSALSSMKKHLDPKQFGNQKNVSTSHCLINIIHPLYQHSDKLGTVSVVLKDFSKAFDFMVNHNIAVERLLEMEVSSNDVAWIADFLSKRTVNYKLNTRANSLMNTSLMQVLVKVPSLVQLFLMLQLITLNLVKMPVILNIINMLTI